MRDLRALCLGPLLLLLAAAPAAGEGYCVACFGPDAVYRCLIDGRPENAPPDPGLQIQCIKTLAMEGKHARCSVERFSTAGCNGPVRTIAADPAGVPPAPEAMPAPKAETGVPRPAGTAPADPPAEEAETANDAGPPRTVEELAKSTAASTKKSLDGVSETVKDTTKKAGEQIEGAGSALGNAAKKSWNCLTSLFSDC